MKTFSLRILLCMAFLGMLYLQHFAQTTTDPAVVNWQRNLTGHTYNGDSTDVISVWYNTNYVYIVTNKVPSYYDSLTWASSSAFAALADRTIFRLDITPDSAVTNEEVAGFVGIWNNGTIIASPGDGQYYDPNNQGLTEWARIAWYFEGLIFSGGTPSPWGDLDETYGHSTPQGVYHYHVYNNRMVADIADSSSHSGIIGYAFDGYPVYGPYGFSDPNDPNSAPTRMTSSYQIRNMSNRNTLPDSSTSVNPPPINSSYPLGCFIEDYEFVAGSGDLDEHNGRICVTPDYPNGTYAYFITLDDTLGPYYPYMVGPTYYGDKYWNGPQPSTSSIPNNAVEYTGTMIGIWDYLEAQELAVFPNPSSGMAMLRMPGVGEKEIRLFDMQGRMVFKQGLQGEDMQLDLTQLPAGMYIFEGYAPATGQTSRTTWTKR